MELKVSMSKSNVLDNQESLDTSNTTESEVSEIEKENELNFDLLKKIEIILTDNKIDEHYVEVI